MKKFLTVVSLVVIILVGSFPVFADPHGTPVIDEDSVDPPVTVTS